ncbi:MAG: hypothetical protein Kow00129_05130 [Thermoleophilia bacterium]
MGEFIEVVVRHDRCAEPGCAELVGLCPVDIFVAGGQEVQVDEEQVDECTLCGLCWEAEPDAVTVRKLYLEN